MQPTLSITFRVCTLSSLSFCLLSLTLTRRVPQDEVHPAAVDLKRGLRLVEARRDVLLQEKQREKQIRLSLEKTSVLTAKSFGHRGGKFWEGGQVCYRCWRKSVNDLPNG